MREREPRRAPDTLKVRPWYIPPPLVPPFQPPASPSPGAPPSIHCLAHIGDSITTHRWQSGGEKKLCAAAHGNNTECQQGWRCLLWQKLIDNGAEVAYNGRWTQRKDQKKDYDNETDICTRNGMTFRGSHHAKWNWMTTDGFSYKDNQHHRGLMPVLNNWFRITMVEEEQCTPTCVTIHLGAHPDLTGGLPLY